MFALAWTFLTAVVLASCYGLWNGFLRHWDKNDWAILGVIMAFTIGIAMTLWSISFLIDYYR